MLEGLEVSVVPLSKVIASAETQRFDPEYFQKQHLVDSVLVKKRAREFQSFVDLGLSIDASAFYPAIEEFYGSGDLPFLRVADVDTVIDFETCTRIPASLCARFPTLARVNPGDIIFTKGGSVARIGLVTQQAAVSRDLIFLNSSKLPRKEQIFLYLYFQTAFFNRMLLRSSSQTAQPHLTITLVRNLPVFRVEDSLKDKCVELVDRAYAARAESIAKVCEAEATLISALGLGDWHPPEPLTYTRRASEAFTAGRLDAEHFQPRYDQMIHVIESNDISVVSLGQLIEPVVSGFDFRDFTEHGTPYIRVGDIKNGRIEDENAMRVSLSANGVGKDIQLRIGDVLFTRKGSFGNAAPVRAGQEHCIISTEIIRVRISAPWKEKLLSEYLAAYFNGLVGNAQAEKWAHGAAFFSVTQDDLYKFRVPIPPLEIQARVRQLLDEAEASRARAHALLDAAKHAVEIAIEESEAAALSYLKDL